MKTTRSLVDTQAIFVETLEDRIAPASATFVDVDGDIVKVMTSKGTNAELQAIVDTAVGGDPTMASQMQTLALTSSFAGGSLKIAVSSKVAAGDGLVNVWYINATGLDMGAVEVGGDLAKMTGGDANYDNGSVKSVKVQSIGVDGGATDKAWLLLGSTTSFNVAGNVNGAALLWDHPGAEGTISVGTLSIGGDLIGGAADGTGLVEVTTTADGVAEIKTLVVGGGLIATNYNKSGSIIVGNTAMTDEYVGKIGKATIGGSLTGFAAKTYSGTLFAATSLGDTTVGGSLNGGGEASGSIFGGDKIVGKVKVGGSLNGGAGNYSGAVFANYGLKAVEVGGGLEGAGGAYSGAISAFLGTAGDVKVGTYISGGSGVHSGAIYGQKGLGNVWVGGSVFGGSNDFAGSIAVETGAGDFYKIGNVTILGDLYGGSDTATGQIAADTGGAISIAQSIVGGTAAGTGSLYFTTGFKSLYVGKDIVGGAMSYAGSVRALGATAKITSITVGGDLIGDAGLLSGGLDIDGTVTTFKVGGDLVGDAGASSGSILMNNGTNLSIAGGIAGGGGTTSGSLYFVNLKNLSVGTGSDTGVSIYGGSAGSAGKVDGASVVKATFAGNIVGGSFASTGLIDIDQVGTMVLGGDLRGGSVASTGNINIANLTVKLTVGGDVLGTDNRSNTGSIFISSNAKNIEILGNLEGGDASTNNITNSGAILVTGALTTMTVGENITAGSFFSGALNNGAVRAGSIGTMLVKGSITGVANQHVLITGQGDITKTSGMNYAIKSLTVNGSVTYADILGGYDTTGTTLNGNGGNDGGSAQIGTVTVLNGFLNSNIATGVSNDDAASNHWADGSNVLLAKPAGSAIVASIAKIVLKGAVFGNVQSGIAAEQIKSLNIGGFAVPVAAGAQHAQVSGGNFFIQQVVA